MQQKFQMIFVTYVTVHLAFPTDWRLHYYKMESIWQCDFALFWGYIKNQKVVNKKKCNQKILCFNCEYITYIGADFIYVRRYLPSIKVR